MKIALVLALLLEFVFVGVLIWTPFDPGAPLLTGVHAWLWTAALVVHTPALMFIPMNAPPRVGSSVSGRLC